MNKYFYALAPTLSVLALVAAVYVVTSNPQRSADQAELDHVLVRLSQLEERLQNLPSGLSEGSTPGSESAAPGSRTEGNAPAADESALLARLETLETRLRGMEGGPVQRALTYIQSGNAELRKRGVYSLEALAKIDPEALAALREMLTDDDAGVCLAALDTLADIGDKESIPLVASLLDDENAEVRREAINTLTRLGGKEAASEIAPYLSDENDEVRRLAADSMGKLGYTPSADDLLSALDDPNLGVRGEAISSLGEIGATGSLPKLRDLYAAQAEGAHRDADHRVRLAMAMKQLGDRSAVQAEIERLGRHIHYENNGGAMRALMWIGRDEPAAMEIFAKAAQVSDTEWIRRAARHMLKQDE